MDNSIDNEKYIENNVLSFQIFNTLKFFLKKKIKNFKFHHISTDEIYGDVSFKSKKFNENSNTISNFIQHQKLLQII